MTVVNLLRVLTQDLEPTRVPVTKDILGMERLVKVSYLKKGRQNCTILPRFVPIR